MEKREIIEELSYKVKIVFTSNKLAGNDDFELFGLCFVR
jgi:hypothetical protein